MSADSNCPCDRSVHPEPLAIDAGLTSIPRQIAGFAEFRQAMLAGLPAKSPLFGWRARGDQDLGVMLIEMWAYVCDLVAFYDETIAHESYLRTARLSPSLRKLVGLLGYRPRPAVAAHARVAVKADGRLPIELPAGLAFRSSAFGTEPPQVFELDAATLVHPLLNGWGLAPTRPTSIPAGSTTLLLAADSARVRPGDHLLVESGGSLLGEVYSAQSVAKIVGSDGAKYSRITLDTALPAALPLAGARLLRPGAVTALWVPPSDSSGVLAIQGNSGYKMRLHGWGTGTPSLATGTSSIALSGLVPQIKASSYVIAMAGTLGRAFRVTATGQDTPLLVAGTSFGSGANAGMTPDIRVPVTRLSISPSWPAALGTDPGRITIEYNLQDAGTIVAELNPRIQPGDPLLLLPPVEAPPDGSQPGAFLVADADGTSGELSGGVNFASRILTPTQSGGLTNPLDPPATVYANIAALTRGETVAGETLGVGDGSIPNQTYKLKKKPLTYLATPTGADPNGVSNTLRIWVQDIEWQEVPSFFGVAPDATVYVVRQNDDADSLVTFGDSIRGARLPTGAPVVAAYRFGAGAASPPAGGIIQLAKPVKGITSVKNPVPASGGADGQPATQVRTYAPRSALLFGRAVSIADMEALAAGQPGVLAAQAQWTWNEVMQLPAVQLWYIGPDGVATAVSQALRAATAPSTPITAGPAQPVAATLVVDLTVDRRYRLPLVRAAVIAALSNASTGLLSAQRIGIGAPLFRSRILAEVLAVPGVSTVVGLLWQGAAFDDYGEAPGSGKWFDVTLTVNAAEDSNG